jgi:hypothetical protein
MESDPGNLAARAGLEPAHQGQMTSPLPLGYRALLEVPNNEEDADDDHG